MKKNIILLLFICTILVFGTFCSDVGSNGNKRDNYVLILSMDGYRYDYSSRFETPNLDYIKSKGVVSYDLKPVFPTFTFPNHYSIATGLYPDNHGIIANNFYCFDLEKSYFIRKNHKVQNGKFYGGKPIWISAENQNITSATYYWVGSEADIQNVQPTYWKKYDARVSFENRIDTVVHWLNLPKEKRPKLVMMYFNEPDYSGHRIGPESEQIGETIVYLDSLVGVLISEIKNLYFYDDINFIVTSDHGMGEISQEKHINLAQYVNSDWIKRRHGANPVYFMQAESPEYIDSIYYAVNHLENINIWKNDSIPAKLNFGTNKRCLDVTVAAKQGWSIGFSELASGRKGVHGYDNLNPDMKTIFYAMGPAFKNNYVHGEFKTIDIYKIIAHILNIEVPENDADFNRIEQMFK